MTNAVAITQADHNKPPPMDKIVDGRKSLNVLVIEDDAIYSQVLKLLISKVDEFESTVNQCNNTLELLDQYKLQDYDVLLVDYHLPAMTGVQLIKRLHEIYGDTCPPCIILTAESNAEIAAEALRASAYDFIPKQMVTVESLSRSIRNTVTKHELKLSILQHTEELERVNRRLTAKSREMDDFYQTVSHEVKTPLAAAREFVSILNDELVGPLNEQQAEILGLVITSCDQISSHFNDLFEVTRMDAKKITLNKASTTIDSVITRTIASCTTECKAKSISIDRHSDNAPSTFHVDGDRITQVLSNLLGNAIKFSPQNSTISLTVKLTDTDTIRFSVADQGCGISQHDCHHIFNRLYQVEDNHNTDSGAGLGLGLNIAKNLVKLHQGKIWVESELNRGSTFHVELPANPMEVTV